MVLETIALLGLAGADAYLFSTYLHTKKQAEETVGSFSYQSQGIASKPISPQPAAASAGDGAVLSNRLTAIKNAVGDTAFADGVMPYNLGKVPGASQSVADGATISFSASESKLSSGLPAFPASGSLDDKIGFLMQNLQSHDERMQEFDNSFGMIKDRVSALEEMLGVGKQEAGQIEIPLKSEDAEPAETPEAQAAPVSDAGTSEDAEPDETETTSEDAVTEEGSDAATTEDAEPDATEATPDADAPEDAEPDETPEKPAAAAPAKAKPRPDAKKSAPKKAAAKKKK